MTILLDNSQKRVLAGRAAFLSERIARGFDSQVANGEVDRMIEQWRSNLGDENTLEDRLERKGVALAACRRAIATEIWPEAHPLPQWVDSFSEMLHEASDRANRGIDSRFLNDDQPIPFEELLAPFVRYARARIPTQTRERLTKPALADMEHWLLNRLSNLAAQALHVRFQSFLSVRRPAVVFGTTEVTNTAERTAYMEFVESMFDSGFVEFFHDYTALARHFTGTVESWVTHTTELYSRLDADTEVLSDEFGIDSSARVVRINPGLSDRHDNGRTVVRLAFSSGKSIVYKPRDISVEARFYDLIRSFSENDAVSDFRSPAYVSRRAYGWVEHVESRPCNSEGDVGAYYRRAGELLCLLYVLNAADCHFENIIASGSFPVVVDAETVLHPRLAATTTLAKNGSEEIIEQVIRDSVLETDFLPWHPGSEDADRADVSGIGGAADQSSSQRQLVWYDINTDRMDFSYEPERVGSGENVPTLNGQPKPPEGYVDSIQTGFDRMYDALRSDPEDLTSEQSSFTDTQVRYIFRGTRLYQSLLNTLTQPENLHTGIDQSLEIEKLTRPFLSETWHANGDLWPLFEHERDALTRLDVPRFTAPTTRPDVTTGDTVVEAVLEDAPVNTLRDPMQELSTTDKRTQLDYIELSLRQPDSATWHRAQGSVRRPAEDEPVESLDYVDFARSIGDDILNRSVSLSSDDRTWVTQDYDPDSGRLRIRAVDKTLYAGRCGIALFFAALARIDGDDRYERAALETIRPLRATVSRMDLEEWSLGGATGVGSMIYGAVRTGEILGHEDLIDEGAALASRISCADIVTDNTYDVVEGVAGLTLSLLTLYEERSEAAYLDLARACGDHLCDARTDTKGGYRVWRADNEALAGFAHGAAGIAYALFRLYEITGESRFYHAGREAIAFEDSLYTPTAENWPDRRSGVPHQFMDGWCHGRSGIGLARAGIPNSIDVPGVHQDVQNAADAISADELLEDDHVCCGNFSRVEFLSVASRRLNVNDYRQTADSIVSNVVRRVEDEGRLQCLSHTGRIYNAGFFRGTSGIGYSLLRLEAPEILPSVLLFE